MGISTIANRQDASMLYLINMDQAVMLNREEWLYNVFLSGKDGRTSPITLMVQNHIKWILTPAIDQ